MGTRRVTAARQTEAGITFVTGDDLRLRRLVRRLRQDDVAAEMGVSRPMVSKIEAQLNPSLEHVEAYVAAVVSLAEKIYRGTDQ